MRRSDHKGHLLHSLRDAGSFPGSSPGRSFSLHKYSRLLLYNRKEVKATTEEVEVYIDHDRLPGCIGRTKDDPLKHIGAADVERIWQWICSKVSGDNEVFAFITGRASRFVNMVATAELASCKNVTRIGWSQAGMVLIVVKDLRRHT